MSYQSLPISEDTKRLLDMLREKKTELDKYKRVKGFWMGVTVGMGFLSLYVFYYYILLPLPSNSILIFKKITEHSLGISLLIGVLSSHFLSKYYTDKHQKAKKKYDDLRYEAIDRFSGNWLKSKEAKIIDTISAEMKQKYGINLTSKT